MQLCKCRSTKSPCASYIVRDVDTSTSTSPAVVKHSSHINESLPLPYSRIEQFDNFYVAARAVVQGEEALTSAATLLDSQHAQQQLSQLASSSSSSSSAASTHPVSKKMPRNHHRHRAWQRSRHPSSCGPPSDSSEIADVKHSGIQNSDVDERPLFSSLFRNRTASHVRGSTDDLFVADSDPDDHDGIDLEVQNPTIIQEHGRINAYEFDQDNESPMGQLIEKTRPRSMNCNRTLNY